MLVSRAFEFYPLRIRINIQWAMVHLLVSVVVAPGVSTYKAFNNRININFPDLNDPMST
jgi:hypothetical protein